MDAEGHDIVIPGYDSDGCNTLNILGDEDEALILRAPDLYHTLKDLLSNLTDEREQYITDDSLFWDAEKLLAEIERMAQSNG